MNIASRSIIPLLKLSIPVLAVLLWTGLGARSIAGPTSETVEATPVAKAWLDQIDAGLYEESYLNAGEALHTKVSEDKWLKILQVIRKPQGKVLSRELVDQDYKPNGFEGVSGEYVLLSYETSFEKLPSQKELVVLKREDGKWQTVGYNFGPKDTSTADAPAPTDTTTSQTTVTPTTQGN